MKKGVNDDERHRNDKEAGTQVRQERGKNHVEASSSVLRRRIFSHTSACAFMRLPLHTGHNLSPLLDIWLAVAYVSLTRQSFSLKEEQIYADNHCIHRHMCSSTAAVLCLHLNERR